jgi:predicted transposase/invertase (TIGR01784 family)
MNQQTANFPPDEPNKFVRFDWAAKRMLRDKANFGVLEGLITVLLGEKITIVELLESEANQNTADDKYNRVDIKAKNSKDEIIIVEIQLTRQYYYLERLLYGVSKAITEHIALGEEYSKVKKIYSISIIYFDLGRGSDYLYHGTTHFVGVHTNDELSISAKEEGVIKMRTPQEVFPEYYIIRVNEFNRVATTPLEDWIDYLKTGNIRPGTEAPGLEEARQKLRFLAMDKSERDEYVRDMENIMYEKSVLKAYRYDGIAEGLKQGRAEGREEGLKEGREEGREEERIKAIKAMSASGMSAEQIAAIYGLSVDEVKSYLQKS